MADLLRSDFVRKVLEECKVAATGQPISAEDAKIVDDALPGIFGELAIREVCNVDADAIPQHYGTWLTVLVANHVGSTWGYPRDLTAIRIAEQMLSDMDRPRRKRRLQLDSALRGGASRRRA